MWFMLELIDDDYVTYSFFGYGMWHTFGGFILANPVVQAIMNGPAAQMLMNSSLGHYLSSMF